MPGPFGYGGKHAVITGASSGVGVALVQVLRDLDVGRITALDLKPCEGDVDAFTSVDLADPAAIDDAAIAIEGPVDVLFNNAGVAATVPTKVVMSVNASAPKRLTFALLDRMPSGAAVVNTASTAGGAWAERVGPILELLAIDDWDEAFVWMDDHPDVLADPYAFSKECRAGLLHVGVQGRDGQGRAGERRLPRRDRDPAVGRLQRHDDRTGPGLDDLPRQRSTGDSN